MFSRVANDEGGFQLVELMVAMVVAMVSTGLLIYATTSVYRTQRFGSQDSDALASLRAVQRPDRPGAPASRGGLHDLYGNEPPGVGGLRRGSGSRYRREDHVDDRELVGNQSTALAYDRCSGSSHDGDSQGPFLECESGLFRLQLELQPGHDHAHRRCGFDGACPPTDD